LKAHGNKPAIMFTFNQLAHVSKPDAYQEHIRIMKDDFLNQEYDSNTIR
jgi:hypothetical protein